MSTRATLPAELQAAVNTGELSYEEAWRFLHKVSMDKTLSALHRTISAVKNAYLDPDSLRKFNIEFTLWDKKNPSGQPIFFEPFSHELLYSSYDIAEFDFNPVFDAEGTSTDDLYTALSNLEAYTAHRQTKLPPSIPPSSQAGWGCIKSHADIKGISEYGDLLGDYRNRYIWFTTSINVQEDKETPHMIATSVHSCDPSESNAILRSEMMLLIWLMRWRGLKNSCYNHDIIPVLIISIRPAQVNIIEGYFDGEKLNVHYRKPISLAPRDPDQQKNAVTVLRWSLATLIGETRSFDALRKMKTSSSQDIYAAALARENRTFNPPTKMSSTPDQVTRTHPSNVETKYSESRRRDRPVPDRPLQATSHDRHHRGSHEAAVTKQGEKKRGFFSKFG